MHSNSLIVVVGALVASGVHAINFPIPRATDTKADGYDLIGFSPIPTTAPSPHQLRARYNGLFQPRQEAVTNTCGYFDGDESEPYTCGFGSACIWNTASDYFGCCSVDGGGNFILSDCPGVAQPYTSCYPFSQAANCVGSCYTQNRVCDATLPYCAAGYLTGDSTTYTQYFCNSVSEGATLNLLATFTTDGANVAASSSTTALNTADTGPNSITTITSIQTQTTTPCSTCTTSPDPTPTPHSHAGAIAGGVVGGLIILAGIVGGTIFFLHKRKMNQRRQVHMEVSQNTN